MCDLNERLLPCPMCGNELPFRTISASCVVIECKCGVTLRDGAARTMYNKNDIPPELLPHAYRAIGFTCDGYYLIPASIAFAYAGLTKVWNTRNQGV